MAGQGVEAGATECKFPSVRKTYRRSSTWNARSAPTSPKGGQPSAVAAAAGKEERRVPCLERQTSKARASLPPLQPLAIARRSLEEWPKAALDDMDMADWTTPATPGRRRVKTGPDIKLDLASVQRAPLEPTEIQLKRDKFAFFDKECSRVADYHIYLGSDAVAKNRETLRANGITHVLNCVGFVCPEYFKKDFVYKTLWLQDSPGEDITSLLYDVFDYFEEVGEQDGRVFVHCCQGVSRSTSLVIAYMMWREHRSFEDAFQDVKASRGVTNPNMGFACQLLQCQKRVHAAPMSPNSVLRMYRLAPHSPYDPLHLVPKAVNNPGAGALDSRGAFVIHVPLAIYVWIGQDCDPKIAQAAKVAASQVVRYEGAQGPPHILAEGLENTEFWDSLSKYADPTDDIDNYSSVESDGEEVSSPELNEQRKRAGRAQVERVQKLGVGNRKVPSYSVDFELYQRARQGGVVPPVPSTGAGMATVPTRIPAREDGWNVLRRKFLSGELVLPKETVSVEISDTNSLSPNQSVASSSPLFSPFSVSSSSSSSRHTGSDSPFASPLSHLSSLSPNLSEFSSPCPTQACSSPEFASHYHSPPPFSGIQGSFPSNMKSLPPEFGSKSPAILLAQRRGSTTSRPAQLPGLGDDPPPAPRGMSRKPRLPPSVTDEKSKMKKGAKENGDTGFKFDGLGEICSGIVNEVPDQIMYDTDCKESNNDSHTFSAQLEHSSTNSSLIQDMVVADDPGPSLANEFHLTESISSWKAILESGHPVLYAWPHLERIDMFDADDLDTKGLFVLVAPQQVWNGTENVVYVWVGREVEQHTGNGDANLQPVGEKFFEQMKCGLGAPIRVVREGHEPEEFWENFNLG